MNHAAFPSPPANTSERTLFCLYVYSRDGTLLHYHEWARPRARANAGSSDDAKMMYGLLFSLNAFAQKVDPTAPPVAPGSRPPPRRVGFRSFRTSTYKLHFYEVPSGVQFALLTDPGAPDLREALRHVHAACYVDLVAKSPLHTPGRPFVSEAFDVAVTRYLRSV